MKNTFLLISVVLLSACDFEFPGFPGADEKFGKQNFVSAVSLIELHKVRNDEYPDSLSELEYLGYWDGIWISAVRYEKNGDGYNLYVVRGWMKEPSLEIPEGFRRGLGLRESNVTWTNG